MLAGRPDLPVHSEHRALAFPGIVAYDRRLFDFSL